jgi:hypothetical protein
MDYPDYLSVEDWDAAEGLEDVKISGLEIDCLQKFTKSLAENGMKSVAEYIDISQNEYYIEILKDIEKHPSIKVLFGESKMWGLLSKEEKQDVVISNYIEKYDTTGSTHMLKQTKVLPNNYTGKPSIEQLLQFKKDRVMIVNESKED